MAINEIIDLTQSLIRFKSVAARPDQIKECATFICNFLATHHIDYQCNDHNGIPTIFALPKPGFAPLLLMSHLDVVAGPDHLFEPFIKNGRLYGRGAIDDKYAAALSLVMLKNELIKLRAAGKDQTHLSFGILITGDEEVGGYNGAQEALKQVKTGFCIALDGGRPKQIVVKEKGVLRLKLTGHGKAAHGARPWLGVNAIERLIGDYQRIKRHFALDTPDHWHRTINWGIVRAGESVNQVPDYAEASLDIRFTENDDMKALIEQIRAEIEGEIEIKEQWPLFISGESPYLALLQEVARSAECVFEHGASDARFLSSHGVSGVVWGADGEMSQHSVDEHVVIESVADLHRMLTEFIAQVGLGLQHGKL